MNYNWENINWIFKPDGSLRDIYIQNTSIEDWGKLIDLLNSEYNLKYFSESKIDKDEVLKYLKDETGELECRTVSIEIENIKINCHFFLIEQIEFDIEPSEIKTKSDFEKVLSFMSLISSTLKKQITLTGENEANFPLVKINTEESIFKIITEKEIEKYYNKNNSKIKNSVNVLKFSFLMRFFPRFMKNRILRSANEPIKATKLNDNIW
ncbi:hypothetical protein [Flavobacterium covae]